MRARPYVWYVERTKMRYDAVDRNCYDAINLLWLMDFKEGHHKFNAKIPSGPANVGPDGIKKEMR